EYYLPEFGVPRLEISGHREQIEFPHAVETLAVFLTQLWPCPVEILETREKRLRIVVAEIMPVFDLEQLFDIRSDEFRRGKYTAREDIFIEPRIWFLRCAVHADGV